MVAGLAHIARTRVFAVVDVGYDGDVSDWGCSRAQNSYSSGSRKDIAWKWTSLSFDVLAWNNRQDKLGNAFYSPIARFFWGCFGQPGR